MNSLQKIQVVRVKETCTAGFSEDLSASDGIEVVNDELSSGLVDAVAIDMRTCVSSRCEILFSC